MTSDELTAEEAKVIGTALFPGRNYIARLIKAMEKAGFLPDDPLYRKAEKVRDAMHDLFVFVHYKSCGVGAPAACYPQTKADAVEGTRAASA